MGWIDLKIICLFVQLDGKVKQIDQIASPYKEWVSHFSGIPSRFSLVPGVVLIPLQIATKLSMKKLESILEN